MDIDAELDIKQEQLPQVRQVTRLDEIPKVLPPRPILPVPKKTPIPLKPKSFLRYYLIGLIVFGIIGLELTIIYRYDTLNKRLYNISASLKNKLNILQHKYQHSNKINAKLADSRIGLISNYTKLGSQYRILQFKLDNYKESSRYISLAKLSKINILKTNLRVSNAHVDAVDVKNELLSKKLLEIDGYINELTSKLITNIGEQEALVNENLRLKKESERLSNELQVLKGNIKAATSEEKNVTN